MTAMYTLFCIKRVYVTICVNLNVKITFLLAKYEWILPWHKNVTFPFFFVPIYKPMDDFCKLFNAAGQWIFFKKTWTWRNSSYSQFKDEVR